LRNPDLFLAIANENPNVKIADLATYEEKHRC